MGGVASSEISSLANYASVSVAVEKTTYVAGETVRGYVQLAVHQQTAMTAVTASFAGSARTTVHYTTHSGSGNDRRTEHRTARETRCVLQMEAAVAHFPSGACEPGTFQCPFEFALPAVCPSTLARHGGGRNTASIDYCVFGLGDRRW